VSDHAIDEVILTLLPAGNGHWKKVALVMSKVAGAVGKDIPEGDDGINSLPDALRLL
jgi:hypothetical protein